jgi:hypothetical protein
MIRTAVRLGQLAYDDNFADQLSALGLVAFNNQRFMPGPNVDLLSSAAFAASDNTNKILYISFRGTYFDAPLINLNDLLTDIAFSISSSTINSYVNQFSSWVENVLSYYSGYKVLFNGHSLGGMVAESFVHTYRGSADLVYGVGFGSPGISEQWQDTPSDHFFHITRDQDIIGTYNILKHIGPTLFIDDAEFGAASFTDIPQALAAHSVDRYSDQIIRIWSAPFSPYLSFALPILFLSTEHTNNVTMDTAHSAIFGGGYTDVIRAAPTGSLFADGGGGSDEFYLGAYEDIVSGGSGLADTVVFQYAQNEYRLFRNASGIYTVRDLATGSTDQLFGIELLRFADTNSRAIGDFDWSGNPPPPPPPPSPPPSPPPPSTPGDDYGNSAATAFQISSNTAFSGKIETAGDQDWFKVTLQAGTLYGFSMTGGSVGGMSALTSPHLYLYDASGNLLDDASPVSINAVFQASVPTTDTYYVRASSHASLGIGGYAVALTPLGSAPTSPPPPPSPSPVRLDLDSVDPRMEEDGDNLVFKVEYSGDLTEDIVIGWEVRGTGAHPTDTIDFVHSSGTVTLRESRNYVYIRLSPNEDRVDEYDETFELTIRVLSGNASISDDDAGGTIINDDQGLVHPDVDEQNDSFQAATPVPVDEWSRGFVTTFGDEDYFAVTLTAGATYELIVIGDDDTSLIGGDEDDFIPLVDPQAKLYGPNFELITSQFEAPINSRRISYDFTPGVTGTYYVVVREDGNNDVGQYFVKADLKVPADDFTAGSATTGRLLEGELGLGYNERDGDDDWFAVNLVAGETYSFYAIDEGSASFNGSGNSGGYIWPGWVDDLRVALLNPQGAVLATPLPSSINSDSFPAQFSFTATTSGTYFLSVSGTPDSGRYFAGFDRIIAPPGSPTAVLQPGPVAGTDLLFPHLRDHSSEPGQDLDHLSVGGFFLDSSGSALRFDLGSLPEEASFAAVDIYFSGLAEQTVHPPFAMVLGTPLAQWDEGASLSDFDNYAFESILPAPEAVGWYRIEITDLYNAWQNETRANTGIVLLPVDLSTTTSLFHSSDYSDPTLRPRLLVYERAPDEILGTADFDILSGTPQANRLLGLSGDDLISGLAGADWIDGGAGADIIDGGDGIDVVSYAASPTGVSVDLASNQHSRGWAEGDSLVNVETVEGSAFSDRLMGGIFGDTLLSGNGNDILNGAAGNDTLEGGLGNDRLFGGAGADLFVFTQLGDSHGYALRSDGKKYMPDIVADFASGEDKIDLSVIDAIAGTAADDAFRFIGTSAFSHHAGELRIQVQGGSTLIFADVDGDGGADMTITAMNSPLQAADFIL